MSSFVPTFQDVRATDNASRAETKPPAKGGPVLMADCITPVAGETLLSLLWKRWDKEEI
ncbi:hypothetical protein [Marivita hallyeonensis]|uniref:Uncharacterized protein n=1 Tax=Marivita hallyeonensis TaxID=996342 RepID=A0A1M5TPE9_9RHOB|nr:hypothetical protein [Marivita hallyeonensis]SHH52695.1 hypothetical protein SAMN05443551_2315 [Marivita hallyeonensis]